MQKRIFAHRYVFELQTPSLERNASWRAHDEVLNRWVDLHLLPVTDPRADMLVSSAEHAAALEVRGAVGILDVIPTASMSSEQMDESDEQNSEAQFVGVVTQCLPSTTLAQYIQHDDGMPLLQVIQILRSVAMTLTQAHAQGIMHGAVHAQNILFADSGEIVLQGFGIDWALSQSAGSPSAELDVIGLGQTLHFMLTQESVNSQGSDDDTLAIRSEFGTDLLSQGIPASVTDFYRSTQNGTLGTMVEVVEALSILIAALTQPSGQPIAKSSNASPTAAMIANVQQTSESVRKWPSILMASIFILLLSWGGWQLLTHNFRPSGVPSALLPGNVVTDPLATHSPEPQVSNTTNVRLANLTSIRDYDPDGNLEENPNLTSFAIDNNPATAWTTVQYRGPDLAGKSGVGLLLDLGKPATVAKVRLDFSVPGQDVSVYVTNNSEPDRNAAELLGSVTDSDTSAVVGSDSGLTGRYVLVWLTRLPRLNSGPYESGITEIKVVLS